MGPGLLNKYIWLVRKLLAAGDRGLTLGEISEAWSERFSSDYPRRTFNNHREAVEEVFGITIECNRSTNRYLIRHGEDVMDTDAGIAWLIDTFTVNEILSLGKERLSGRVSVEDIPSGRKFLAPLMNAMQHDRVLSMVYGKYGEEPRTYRIHPYAVKESDQRWYLVGYSEERKACRVYALDRISSMNVLDETFMMPENFDVDELFATAFGTYISDTPGITIEFKAFGKEISYIRDLPLHKSQRETAAGDGFSVFSIFVSPNTNLYLEFLGHGAGIEVLSPPEIRNTMADLTRKMSALYDKNRSL